MKCFFCFTQKTAYEMRISDWSSDVCSSDLQVMRGIRSEDYAAYDSAAGERVDPVLRWDVQFTGTTDQIEVWPIPASNGMRLQVFGKKVLAPLIEDDDRDRQRVG